MATANLPRQSKLVVRQLEGEFGAEIMGLDCSRPIPSNVAEEIRAAWIKHGILLFRDAVTDDEGQMRISCLFGELEAAATADLNDPDNRFMMTLAYDPAEPNGRFQQNYNVAGIDRAGWLGWHWDQSFMPTIVRGAGLRMVEPATTMGQTGFIDAIGAFERLPDALRRRIEKLEVVYEFNPDFASGQFGFPDDIRPLPGEKSGAKLKWDFPPVVHPMIITQQETGRKVLKLSPMHARYILGMDWEKSYALLRDVAVHLTNPDHAYFHSWQKNDLLIWDNWRVIHSATGVPLDVKRVARRTTITGDYKVGRYLDETLNRERDVIRLVD